ncbi:Hypothetical_protein [Hexamita inflata]|uniref:Hypothetical_protein n=1 Tax=Hexamita inflata TaxID=28002 RepID=A0AA86NMZ8_9EUKA|nr:Hypothetical protein HINF_LOCUS10179 [Hexamita inflata]
MLFFQSSLHSEELSSLSGSSCSGSMWMLMMSSILRTSSEISSVFKLSQQVSLLETAEISSFSARCASPGFFFFGFAFLNRLERSINSLYQYQAFDFNAI